MTTIRSMTIAALNDAFRRRPFGAAGRLLITRGVASLGPDAVRDILQAVAAFDAFTPANDPHQEHDCAILTMDDERILWKVDYYEDARCEFGAPDGRDCYRVLTVMLASEY